MSNNLFFNMYRRSGLIFLLIIIFFVSTFINAQSITIQGRVTSNRYPVNNASVIFIDNSDTTLQYSTVTDSRGSYSTDLITSIESGKNSVPTKFQLGQSYPNPFSSSTAIPYGIKEESNIHVAIYDILGRVVRKFEVGRKSVGKYNLLWDGKNNLGNKVANGIYFYKFLVGGESHVRKMIFNQNGNNDFVSPTSFSITNNESFQKAGIAQAIQGTNFKIRLRNTSTTIPLLVEEDRENIVIQSDTTIHFSVSTKSISIIDNDSTHQIIRGFGASNILLWRPDMTDSEIETAFGTGDGQLGFTILRIMVEADSNRWVANLATAKKALDLGAIIIASPWHAPSEMRETFNGNEYRVRYDMYEEYAQHLNDFAAFMNDNGVPLYGISIQNEPDIGDWTQWTPNEIFTFIKDYSHTIEGPKVMAPESFHFDKTYSDPILNDSLASANTDIICGHIYGSGNSKYQLAKEKGKEVWMTEYLINSQDNSPNMDTSHTAAMETAASINGSLKADMSAYVWWYLVRYYGPIADGTFVRKGEVTKKGYVMSQFARFVRPGYYRVESRTTPTLSNVSVSSYKDPKSSKRVLIAINNSDEVTEHNFRINDEELTTTFIPYTTSETKNCELGEEFTIINNNFKLILEPKSITTFVSN